MSKITPKGVERFKKIHAVIYSNKRIAIVKPYTKNWIKNCTDNLVDSFKVFLVGIAGVVCFPFMFVRGLYSFLPTVFVIKEESDEKSVR